ncbi:glutathione S-transferase N-terminal domain-containing protein [Sabulicella rubraurantiaca]|uniref:glutathione S-transferase N-terminal domain-containing protein n=1 Tax=Sabulicella rubraurantiaca TaxID=2811429 RepID=UPI001A970365|nr:glutathione S-transferase N-terminal domain-containing protein [Sabulicella rubraurantiaca]
MYALISATPSPYARRARIALIEKGIPFELRTEVPWEGSTATPRYNPLEKLPVLVLPDGTGIYESRFILEWLEAKHPEPRLLPDGVEAVLEARQCEVIADGICDATVLLFFERQREAPSGPWIARQRRKVEGGLAALEARAGSGFLVGERFGLADIAVGAALRYLDVRFAELGWRKRHPKLSALSDRLEERESFKATVPVPQMIREAVV